jgi:hypothetical protein
MLGGFFIELKPMAFMRSAEAPLLSIKEREIGETGEAVCRAAGSSHKAAAPSPGSAKSLMPTNDPILPLVIVCFEDSENA